MIRFFKFLMVGGSTAIFQLSLFYIFLSFFRFEYKIAVTISFTIALVYHFMANKMFTFNSSNSSKKVSSKEIIKYAISSGISYSVVLISTIIFVEKFKINPVISNFFAILINVLMTFSLLKFWVFNEQRN